MKDFFFPRSFEKDARVEWRKDLVFKVDGIRYEGMALVPKKDSYNIKIYPPEDRIDRLQWMTCHREDYVDKAVESGFWPWSKSKKYYEMIYQPQDLEMDRACPLRFAALVEKHLRFSFGMMVIPFSQEHISLRATVNCDGETRNYKGTSICQGATGSIQKIYFNGKVYQDDRLNSLCPPMDEVKEGVFEFIMPSNECVYVFVKPEKHEQTGRFLTHKLITFGFDRLPPPPESR